MIDRVRREEAFPTSREKHTVRTPEDDSIVLLVVPPFQGLRCPALGVSQLKANLLKGGLPAEVLYLNLLFARRITPYAHEWLAATGPCLLGEFLFSHAIQDRPAESVRTYVEEVLVGTPTEQQLRGMFPGRDLEDLLHEWIREATDFVRTEAIEAVLSRNPWMVGFSSTFQSNCCSLAVIRELKRHHPEIYTVMGGANCEADMGAELLRLYPDIDFVGRGECDNTFVEFARTVRAGNSKPEVAGFLVQGREEQSPPSSPLDGEQLDANPFPDFDDYFGQLSGAAICDQVHPGLAMETSRGCWWGAKHHCTFCAFNRLGMIYRSKNGPRALEELHYQVERYGIDRMEMTDNILDMAYFKTFLGGLAEKPVANLFWETKANLTREQVELMKRSGVRWIQPGIESLSDLTLELMRKGSTQLQNAQLLKYGTELGVRITWIWLFGFPGESEEETHDLARTSKLLHHIQPPGCTTVIYMERFSPYYDSPDEYGFSPLRPARAYGHVYPFEHESLMNLAFFFESNFLDQKIESVPFLRLQNAVGAWHRMHKSSHLLAVPRKGALWILDTRACRTRFLHRLTGIERELYEACDRVRGQKKLTRELQGRATPEEVARALQKLADENLLLKSPDGRYLALATDARQGYRAYPKIFPGGHLKMDGPPSLGKRTADAFREIVRAPNPLRAAARATKSGLRAFVAARAVQLARALATQPPAIGGDGETRAAKAPVEAEPATPVATGG